jgi:hypothetical protein
MCVPVFQTQVFVIENGVSSDDDDDIAYCCRNKTCSVTALQNIHMFELR